MAMPLAYVLARHADPLQEHPHHAGRAAALRRQRGARGRMDDAFRLEGFLNVSLQQVGIINEPLQIMFTEQAVIFGIIAVNLPYMVLTLQSVIEGVNRNVEEAAFSLGAGPMTMFGAFCCRWLCRASSPETILCFILAMNAYATPVLLGGPKFKMMGRSSSGQFQLNNWPFGAAIAFIPDGGDADPDRDGEHHGPAKVPPLKDEMPMPAPVGDGSFAVVRKAPGG